MQISARRVDKITIFDLSGDIDLANSPEIRKALLHEIRERRTPKVVMNLTQGEVYRQLGGGVAGGGPQGVAGRGFAIYFVWIEPGGAGSVAAVATVEDFRGLRYRRAGLAS